MTTAARQAVGVGLLMQHGELYKQTIITGKLIYSASDCTHSWRKNAELPSFQSQSLTRGKGPLLSQKSAETVRKPDRISSPRVISPVLACQPFRFSALSHIHTMDIVTTDWWLMATVWSVCFVLVRCKKWVQNSRRNYLRGKSAQYLNTNRVFCAHHFENSHAMTMGMAILIVYEKQAAVEHC